eukprot:TRINITY_DN4323_c0_g1_i37.p1 TRINITY_DN4323_c0_g1~~TRINITY_DN4323_c0_g1_i37.p1  ORF type:complete len:206 (-),score=49.76 TRINITY_DN4323_c0_g1_i37:14-631(-)
MSSYQKFGHYRPRGHRPSYKDPFEKPYFSHSKKKVCYIPKTKHEKTDESSTVKDLEQKTEVEENVRKEVEGAVDKQLNEAENSLEFSQRAQEEKSDNETLIPDEEFAETPTLIDIELFTKDGARKIEFKLGDSVLEVTSRIVREYGLSKEVENAIKYKLRKVKEQVECEIRISWSECNTLLPLSLIHICRCRRSTLCRSRWSPYH